MAGGSARAAYHRPYASVRGRAVRPCAYTDTATVTTIVAITVSTWASGETSTTITAKTIDARPRGPNQPTNPSVCGCASRPMSAIATGSMRAIVKIGRAHV